MTVFFFGTLFLALPLIFLTEVLIIVFFVCFLAAAAFGFFASFFVALAGLDGFFVLAALVGFAAFLIAFKGDSFVALTAFLLGKVKGKGV